MMRTAPIGHDAPAWTHRGRIPSLDGVRSLAILLVLFGHWHFPGDHFGPLATLKGRCGFLGVQVFFILSGFLVTTLMLREVSREGRLNLFAFYRRRAMRILPAYVAFLGVLVVCQLAGAWSLPGRAWVALLTYTVNFPTAPLPWQISHVWSLSVEEHFYMLWPLLLWLMPPGRCRLTALGAVGLAYLLRWTALAAWPDATVDLWTPTRMDDLAVGCLLAFAARESITRARLDRLAGSPAVMAGVLLAFVAGQVVLTRTVGRELFGSALPPLLALANTVNSLSMALMMWWAVRRPESLPGRCLNTSLAAGIGAISYGLYLWHPLFLQPNSDAWYAQFPANLLLTLVTAVASYYVIERPFLLIKDRKAPVAVPAERSARVVAIGMVVEPVGEHQLRRVVAGVGDQVVEQRQPIGGS